jgi:hypothetical protein
MSVTIAANVGNAEAVRLCEAPGRPARQDWITYSLRSAILLFDVDREFITSIIFCVRPGWREMVMVVSTPLRNGLL